MIIREAQIEDIEPITRVLKASLGESSSKKTENVWRYKHVNNPFGKSLVLVAEENNEIIGVRAFMRWQWQKGEEVFSAFRAVDTATHPKYQGRGIFKKLTLKALELAKERGDHFVFNTPNSQSKPGYLKMGWEEVNKLRIQLRLLNPIKVNKLSILPNIQGNIQSCMVMLRAISKQQKQEESYFTPKNTEYLVWRYVENPLQKYKVICNENYFIAGYLKKRNKINEFRISEVLFFENAKSEVKSAILKMAKNSDATILSISSNSGINFKTGLTASFGPVLTFKNISLDYREKHELLDLSNWDYSLGDLELF